MTTNQSIGRAVALMRAISRSPAEATVSDLARSVGLARTTASRLLATLERHGLIERSASNDRYRLGYELARLGRLAEPYAGVVLRAEPLMRELAQDSGETVTLSVPTPDDRIDVIHQVDGPRLIGGKWWVGDQFPLHASSTGKLLMAEPDGEEILETLPERLPASAGATITSRAELAREVEKTRERGYSTTHDELEDGLFGISVPLRDDRGALFAILSISGPTYRMGPEEREAALRSLRDATARLERILFRSELEGEDGEDGEGQRLAAEEDVEAVR